MEGNAQGITERLARPCAAHPWRTMAAWGLAVLAALVLVATALSGLTSDAHVVGSPGSRRSDDAIAKNFPLSAVQANHLVSDVVVVSSTRYRVDDIEFSAFLTRLADALAATGKAHDVHSYLDE